jgi:hypothetical protein
MMIAATNSRSPTTTVPEMSSSLLPRGLSLGSTSSKIVFMSVAASVHSRCTCSPISGQFFTDSVGNGTEKILASNPCMTKSTLPIRPNPSHVTRPMTITRQSKVISIAASRRLPSRAAIQSNNG